MKNILFICTGNTCRSPMAEAILKQKIKWSGVKGYRVFSAGIAAVSGLAMSENSILALNRLGITSPRFKSKEVTRELLDKADIVICMTNYHKAVINEERTDKVYTINELTGVKEIIDPYERGEIEYIECSREIETACNAIMRLICNGVI